MASILNSPPTNSGGGSGSSSSSSTIINRNSINTIDSSNNNTATPSPRQHHNNINTTNNNNVNSTTPTSTSTPSNNNNNNNNIGLFQFLKHNIFPNLHIFFIVTTISLVIYIILNVTPVFLLWAFALVAVSGTFFQIWYGLRYNSRIIEVNGYHFYPGNNPNNYNNNNNNNNNNGGGGRIFFPNSQFSRLSHLINPPLSLQLTLIDRDFNSNDYDMLLALDNDIQNHGGAKKEQIDLLPTYFIETQKDLESFIKDGDSKACSICLDDFVVNDAIKTLPCIHHYHSDCIEKWLIIKSVCPVCKSNVFE